jgi:hypothetical protein
MEIKNDPLLLAGCIIALREVAWVALKELKSVRGNEWLDGFRDRMVTEIKNGRADAVGIDTEAELYDTQLRLIADLFDAVDKP